MAICQTQNYYEDMDLSTVTLTLTLSLALTLTLTLTLTVDSAEELAEAEINLGDMIQAVEETN
eukprot:284985-Amorphochlora_amoeboformis.AAC.1